MSHQIAFLGDVMLGRLVDQLFPTHVYAPSEQIHTIALIKGRTKLEYPVTDYKYVWGNVLEELLHADVRMINLETSVTVHDVKYPDKAFNYRMHPHNLQVLKEANIEYCSLANNHTLDFGVEGMLETMKSVTLVDVNWAGVGRNLQEARAPAVFTTKGKKFACFSFADHYDYWGAGESKPGINYLDVDHHTPEDIIEIKRLVDRTRGEDNPDVIVFSLHWGPNYCWIPSKQKQDFAHALIDQCGADIIHGHSPHHVQGIELYKGKPILYGCGDFVDDYAVSEEYRNDLGFAYFVDWNFDTKTADQIELIPTKIKNFQVNKLKKSSDLVWLLGTMSTLCDTFGTAIIPQDNGRIKVEPKPARVHHKA